LEEEEDSALQTAPGMDASNNLPEKSSKNTIFERCGAFVRDNKSTFNLNTRRRRWFLFACCCCVIPLIALSLTLIVMWPTDDYEVKVCSIEVCHFYEDDVECGKQLNKAAVNERKVSFKIRAEATNPKRFGAKVNSIKAAFAWVNEGTEVVLARYGADATSDLLTCSIDGFSIGAKSSTFITAMCELHIKEGLGAAMSQYYSARNVDIRMVLDVSISLWGLFNVGVKEQQLHPLALYLPFGAFGAYEFAKNGSLVQIANSETVPISEEDSFVGNSSTCPGAIDVPEDVPSIALCGVDLDVSLTKVGLQLTFRALNVEKLTIELTNATLQLYTGDNVKGVINVTIGKHVLLPYSVTEVSVLTETSLAAAVGLLPSGVPETVDIGGQVTFTILTLTVVVDVPRLRLTPSGSAGGFTFQDFLDMFTGDTCTCLYNCELDTNWNQCTERSGCYYLDHAGECPFGYFEQADCSLIGLVERAFCCPNKAPPAPTETGTGCQTEGTGCNFETGFFTSECPSGTVEIPKCTRKGVLSDDEFCCPA